MAWKETCVMDQRMSFIAACLDGEESIAALCRHFGISRKTGHKWLARYRCEGAGGLVEGEVRLGVTELVVHAWLARFLAWLRAV